MISIQAKKHDNFSVEFKFGFNCKEDGVIDRFTVNSWIFVPNSLDINPEIYGKKQFYRDVKSNVRLITPSYLLREIAEDSSLPLVSLRQAMTRLAGSSDESEVNEYEYHLKMFAAIFKSTLRNHATHLRSRKQIDSAGYLADDYVAYTKATLKNFRDLYRIIDVPAVSDTIRSKFRMCDEFMSLTVEVQTLRIIRVIDRFDKTEGLKVMRETLLGLIMDERVYKKSAGYGTFTDNDEHNRKLVYHRGMLKKFIESELYIRLDKKKDGVAVEQLYYSIAAGIAMIFATAIAWFTQVRYGNITWPLFIVLVVSYMMKDRIKDLMRYYFAHKLGNKYFDKKASITIGKTKVGQIKEGFDFISPEKTPIKVLRLRENASSVDDESRIFEEKIMLYRKHITIDDKALDGVDDYPMRGINEIMRLHLIRFTHKMDNPTVSLDSIDDNGNLCTTEVDKVYYINIIFQLQHDDKNSYHHFRLSMTRNGLIQVKEI